MTPVTKKCLQCGDEFSFRACPTDISTGRGKYCSNECKRKSLIQPIKIYCLYCKEEIFPRPRLNKKFCCKLHADLYKTGVPLPKEVGRKISAKLKGRIPKNFGKEFQYKGERNCKWKGGVTPEREKFRKTPEYVKWRTLVFERDNYTCVLCGQVGRTLNADHIKPFANYPELRLDVNNGRTLCIDCHKKTDTYLSGTRWRKYADAKKVSY